MKKYAKVFFLLLLAGSVLTMGGTFVSCQSTRTMYPTKKHSSRKTVKENISVRGTNDRNGQTYRSY